LAGGRNALAVFVVGFEISLLGGVCGGECRASCIWRGGDRSSCLTHELSGLVLASSLGMSLCLPCVDGNHASFLDCGLSVHSPAFSPVIVVLQPCGDGNHASFPGHGLSVHASAFSLVMVIFLACYDGNLASCLRA